MSTNVSISYDLQLNGDRDYFLFIHLVFWDFVQILCSGEDRIDEGGKIIFEARWENYRADDRNHCESETS